MEKKIAKDLLSIGAVFLRPEQPFTWASGIKSPIYCDNRLTLTAPVVRGHVEAREWVALPRLLADAEQVFAPQAQAREVVLDWPAPVPEVELYSDGKALLGAIVNLLENALVFSPPQGRIRLSLDVGNKLLKLSVQDDGPGVGADVAPRIFDPFFTTRADGTGLGLAIARGVAEVSGGELTLQPSARGACFRLQLPCRPIAEAISH
jgi:two-component system sensor histidine kinase FlrB